MKRRVFTMDEAADNARRALQDSIDLLYRTFGHYPLVPDMHACPCCVSDEARRRLYRAPLRELESHDLDHYAFKAITTWGNESDFRHFLPRLFELQVSGTPLDVDDEVLFGKLRHAQWRTWPEAEQVAVETFLTAWGKSLLTLFPTTPRLPELLCVFAQAMEDLMPFLNYWWVATTSSVPALRHLADAAPYDFRGAFWSGLSAQSEQIEAWLCDPAKEDRLIEGALHYEHEPYYEELAKAADWLNARRSGLIFPR